MGPRLVRNVGQRVRSAFYPARCGDCLDRKVEALLLDRSDVALIVRPMLITWRQLREQIVAFDKAIRALVKSNSACRLLMSVPGIGVRTFLAWVRTGIAVIAFGFIVEKFNLFVLTIASSAYAEVVHRLQLERLSGQLHRYGGGVALIFGGLALIVVATARFVRTGRLLDDPKMHSAGSVRAELILSVVLVLLVAGFSTYLVLG
jgi:inner membrane protein YidH